MRRDEYESDETARSYRTDPTVPSGQVAGGSSTQTMRDRAVDVQEQAGEVAEKAQEQATAVKDKALEQAEAGKQRAASGLHSAADQLRNRTGEEEPDDLRGKAMTKAADTIERSATYLDEHETSEIWDDIEKFVREHPMQAAAGALVAGLVIGRILR